MKIIGKSNGPAERATHFSLKIGLLFEVIMRESCFTGLAQLSLTMFFDLWKERGLGNNLLSQSRHKASYIKRAALSVSSVKHLI